jgi:hypothetical protein
MSRSERMGISDFTSFTPLHKLQVIIVSVLLIICLAYFIKEVIREFPMIIEIFKSNEEDLDE